MIAFWPCSTWDPGFVACLREHYTKSRGAPPGKKRAWRIVDHGAHRGYIGLGEPPYKLAPLRRLGLADARPPSRSVCNFIFRLEREGVSRGSAILRDWHALAAVEWHEAYGWEPEHWLTLVDPERVMSSVPGACFRRAGYRSLGLTTGRTARRPAGHTHGPRVWSDGTPKLVLYRGPLARLPEAA